MKLTVLGCSGSVPGPNSPASGYLVEHEGYRVVLDLGNGAFGGLLQHVRANEVDAIVLSHLHSDHCADIAAYEVALNHGLDKASSPIPLFAPSGARERLVAMARARPAGASVLGPDESRAMSAFAFADVEDVVSGNELGPFRLRSALVAHPVPTYAIRLDVPGGPSLVYSGDTGVCEALVDLAAGADVLLCEAGFASGPNLPPGLHLTGGQAGEHAARAGVGDLILTHVPPWLSVEDAVAEARRTFSGRVHGAFAGAVYDLD